MIGLYAISRLRVMRKYASGEHFVGKVVPTARSWETNEKLDADPFGTVSNNPHEEYCTAVAISVGLLMYFHMFAFFF